MEIQDSITSNGLRVISANLPSFSTAAVAVFVRVGARHENADEHGIAHFLEHMAFKGTKTRSAHQIAMEVECLGSGMNAQTGASHTAYYITGLAKNLGTHVSILGDVLTSSLLRDEDIAVERGVILQEIKQYEDDPFSVCSDQLDAMVYAGNSLSRKIIGTAESVSSFGHDHFARFMDRNYGTSNMFVVAAGLVDHDELCAHVERAFASLKPSASPIPIVPAVYHSGVVTETSKPFEQVSILMAYKGLSDTHPNVLAQRIMTSALGGGMSSPLFQEVREKRGLVYTVGSHSVTHEDIGLVAFHAGTTRDNVVELLRVVVGEVKRIANDGVTDTDFMRARNASLVSLATLVEKPSSLTFTLAKWLQVFGRIMTPQDVMTMVENVTREDVRLAAQRTLAGTAALSLVGPVDTSVDYATILAEAAA